MRIEKDGFLTSFSKKETERDHKRKTVGKTKAFSQEIGLYSSHTGRVKTFEKKHLLWTNFQYPLELVRIFAYVEFRDVRE